MNEILPGPNGDTQTRVAIPLGQSRTLKQEGATWQPGSVLWILSSEVF